MEEQRPTNPGLSDASNKNEEALPELELKEIKKSDEAVDFENSQKCTIDCFMPWNDYTIVSAKTTNEIRIYNEKLKKIEDFKLNSKVIELYWRNPDITDRLKKINPLYGVIVPDISKYQYNNGVGVSQLPIELIHFAEKTLKRANPFTPASMVEPTEKSIASGDAFMVDDYIIFLSEENCFFAFKTKSDEGITLEPRNWKRVNPMSEIPIELSTAVEKIIREKMGIKKINEKYSVLVTDIGLNILKNEDLKGRPLISDNIPSIKKNVIPDPSNTDIVYYCQSSSPSELVKLDLSKDSNTWVPIAVDIPNQYEEINNLQLDPSGNFFFFYCRDELIIITKDTLQEVKRVSKLTNVTFDNEGNIRAVDKDGFLVILQPNFKELEEVINKRKIQKITYGINISNIFDLEVAKKEEAQKKTEGYENFKELRAQYEEQFSDVLAKTDIKEGMQSLRDGLSKMRAILISQGLKINEVNFILEGIENQIQVKEKESASKNAQEALISIRTSLIGGLSMTSISDARNGLDKVRQHEGLLSVEMRKQVEEVSQELQKKSVELFNLRGIDIVKDVVTIVEKTQRDLDSFSSKYEMDNWLEFTFPQLKARLGSLMRDCPIEADEAYKAIMKAMTDLQNMSATYEEKFKREYVKVREKAVERLDAVVGTLENDIKSIVDRLKTKGFTDRQAAEEYLNSSEAKKAVETEIGMLAGQNSDISKELERALKVKLSNALTEIERGALTQVNESGQQMIMFGKNSFPKWEAKVKEKKERKVDIYFDEDGKTHGPGIKASEILGDVSLSIQTSTGKIEQVRLYEGFKDESEWRLGLLEYRGDSIPPSYLSAEEFKKVKKDFSDWSQGENSKLKKELEKKVNALTELYEKRQKTKERTEEADEPWKKEYQEKLKEYAEFSREHNITILKRIDQVKSDPETEYTNGKGYVPEWQSHWVNDPQTEKDLEDMAEAFKMQLDLQEGIFNLKGHAGTGKDVRMKMFCALTNRPYFGIDCTKWTTEFELSEDVVLESKDGASQTLKVPSAVLNGITTAGAVVYFNEFNAMPEQAQIFLHALMDEKRSLTLKTSSGKVIKALPSVLLASSMNPDYPGTFTPQFATRSRMVSLEIGYPPLTRKNGEGDTNPNPPYDASEALRIARGVDSLSDLTYEASIERNEFVKVWDKYVNGIENNAPDLTETQKFDVDATLALVQFANNLRNEFIKIFEKSRDARNALPVSQPITGRELRRCAYALSKINKEEKVTANPEVIVRGLLDKYFLTHIDKKEDQDKIRTTMNTWTSKKRVRV